MPMATRPRVDFPQPDSPTRPMVSPLWMSKDTWSTAFSVPPETLKYLQMPSRERSTSPWLVDIFLSPFFRAGTVGMQQPARCRMALAQGEFGGCSSRQIFMQCLHRAAKPQPLGGTSRSGGVPAMDTNRSFLSESTVGRLFSRAWV